MRASKGVDCWRMSLCVSAMTVLTIAVVMCVTSLSYGQGQGKSPTGWDENPPTALELLYKCRDNWKKNINDYTATLIKQERIDGELETEQEIAMKFQKPHAVHLRWTKEKKGQEVLFVRGKYNEKMICAPSPLLFFRLGPFELDPKGDMAMKNSLRSVTDAGFGNAIDSLINQFELARDNGELDSSYIGAESIFGRDTYRYVRFLPNENKYYCYMMIMNIDKENLIPNRVALYNWQMQLKAKYLHKNVVLNPGLPKKTFDRQIYKHLKKKIFIVF